MLGLLIEDVTLLRQEHLMVHVRFRGGATKSLKLPLALTAWQQRTTKPGTVRIIDELLNDHCHEQIVQILNSNGILTGAGQKFTVDAVHWVRFNHKLKTLRQRLTERGLLTACELARRLGVDPKTIPRWRRAGYLKGEKRNPEDNWMYQIPDPSSLPKSFDNCTNNHQSKTTATNLARGAV
jgi:hypothetical protein